MARSYSPATVCSSFVLAGTLSACAGADLSTPGVAGPHGEVASAESSLREDACWTNARPDAKLAIGESGQTFEAETASGSYDHPGCPHSWIVEATSTLDKKLLLAGGVVGIDGAGQNWCEGFWSESEARGCTSAPCTWAPIGAWSERAKWHPGTSSSPGSCERVVAGALPELPGDHGFTKVRIVTQAGWVYWYHGAYEHVTVP
jgi:hypothetical protein